MNVGDKVKVVAEHSGHEFDIGEIVALSQIEPDGIHAFESDAGEWWYLASDEYEPIRDTPTIGTLADIGAQVGDVVDLSGHPYRIEGITWHGNGPPLRDGDISKSWHMKWVGGMHEVTFADIDNRKFRIVSRASDARTIVDESKRQAINEKYGIGTGKFRELPASPMQLRKVIVPGVYGKVRVGDVSGSKVKIMFDGKGHQHQNWHTRADLIAARDVFSALINAMPDEQ